MIEFIKKNLLIIFIFFITLLVGFVTFLTFINKGFIELNESNLQILLVLNIFLLIFFFILIILEVKNSLKQNISTQGSKTNKKYILFFSLFTLIPSILISIFSLFLFSFALEKYLDNKITTAVNNSYEIAKSYTQEIKNKIESDIILIAYDLNKNIEVFYDNPDTFKNILKTQKLIRNVDEIHLIDSLGNLIISTIKEDQEFTKPEKKALELVFSDERPLKIINAYENKSASILKLTNYIDTYLYVVKFLDEEISNYLTQSREALNFYYTVEEKRTGIKISFIFIYLLIVSLLLFLSISLAIRYSSRFFISISNLIFASKKIGKGEFDIKVPQIKTDTEFETLNQNFNLMIDRLKSQQNKLLLNERHEAWESVAKKLAHEIKNPLTPIQLTIDRLKNKYSNYIDKKEQSGFNEYLKTIIKQINQIESLVNEFSDFARMPKPTFKKIDLVKLISENIKLLTEIDSTIKIDFKSNNKYVFLNCDNEQISRAFFNLIKNSIESIQEKSSKNSNFNKKIDIVIMSKNDYIESIITDNGIGFSGKKIKDVLKPYFTTKLKGSGLGLPIVNKIINDHNGTIEFVEQKIGAKIILKFFNDVN